MSMTNDMSQFFRISIIFVAGEGGGFYVDIGHLCAGIGLDAKGTQRMEDGRKYNNKNPFHQTSLLKNGKINLEIKN